MSPSCSPHLTALLLLPLQWNSCLHLYLILFYFPLSHPPYRPLFSSLCLFALHSPESTASTRILQLLHKPSIYHQSLAPQEITHKQIRSLPSPVFAVSTVEVVSALLQYRVHLLRDYQKNQEFPSSCKDLSFLHTIYIL